MAIDRVFDRTFARCNIDVTDQLVSEEIKVDPVSVAASFATAEEFTVEFSGLTEVSDRNGQVKRAE